MSPLLFSCPAAEDHVTAVAGSAVDVRQSRRVRAGADRNRSGRRRIPLAARHPTSHSIRHFQYVVRSDARYGIHHDLMFSRSNAPPQAGGPQRFHFHDPLSRHHQHHGSPTQSIQDCVSMIYTHWIPRPVRQGGLKAKPQPAISPTPTPDDPRVQIFKQQNTANTLSPSRAPMGSELMPFMSL